MKKKQTIEQRLAKLEKDLPELARIILKLIDKK